MSSLYDVSVSSDSEDDVDYVPPINVADSDTSCDEDENVNDDLIHSVNTKMKHQTGNEVKSTSLTEINKAETSETIPEIDEKKRANDLWASFLSDVESVPPKKSSLTISNKIAEPEIKKENETKVSNTEAASVSKVFEFAGETFLVDKVSNSLDNVTAEVNTPDDDPSEASPPATQKRGLGSVLDTIGNKKQKLTVLEKTRLDWKSFKKNEGIEEDLEKFNKGKQGFIERQRFLERSDLRSFEIEKGMRETLRKR
ncbi:craniofacial development protein 1 [Trichonephila inaurata madagascariensis]|uniref:Craniofacial development protein 1 n=1 Tax=Trichonephila inaurata madagascariensis TaxID=2747483 RepID=A0A8X6YBI9_9ARAC|nr:craniofacial development protein 1 [Trichonephila inaurata madagascariensis]